MGWTPDTLPDLKGKTYVITGGNSGLGLEAAKILGGRGARVVITSRSAERGEAALDTIRASAPDADVSQVRLDLSDADSPDQAAGEIRERCPTLDAVINNAGVMQPPLRRTDEGFELQFATNHLGHFRLNRALFDLLEASEGRIVPVSSIAHEMGEIDLEDLNSHDKRYDATAAYSQSKLANLMYGLELQRRLETRGSRVTSITCHPGYAATNLQSSGVGMDGGSIFLRWLYKLSNRTVAQTATEGAYPLCLAAADPNARAGAYYGPTGLMNARGPVGECSMHRKAKDTRVAAALWDKTEELVGPFFSET